MSEPGSEVFNFILEPRNFAEVNRLSEDIHKPWLKENMKNIDTLINNQSLLVQDSEKCETVTPCMDVYEAKIQSDRSLEKLKLIIVVRGYIQNKKLVGDTLSSTDYVRTLKYFLAYSVKHKARVHQLYLLGNSYTQELRIMYL